LLLSGIVYVRDTTRGGLCSYPVFNNGINGAFCRTEAGQTAAIIFLFVTLVLYLIGAVVCLKLWRHEAARRYQEKHGHEVRTGTRTTMQRCKPQGAHSRGGGVLLQGATCTAFTKSPVVMVGFYFGFLKELHSGTFKFYDI